MIKLLLGNNISPQAIEQPLDMSILENKMMLEIYLAALEVENDRMALNTFYAMRRAQKEGRLMGTASYGYVNKCTEDGRKYVGLKEPEGYTINIFANYESRSGNSLYIIKPRYTIDLSVQKLWFDNKLNTKIGYNNIFDSYDQRLEFRHKQIMDNQFTHWWDTRKLTFSLSYNFGGSKYQAKEIQKTEEENRTR